MKKKLLTSGNVFERTDGRWGGVVWYMDEQNNIHIVKFEGGNHNISDVVIKFNDYSIMNT